MSVAAAGSAAVGTAAVGSAAVRTAAVGTAAVGSAVFALPGASPELTARLAAGLAAVEARLRAVVDHDDPFVAAASDHLVAAGGKRFRPLLTLLAAELGSGWDESVVTAATGVELTHLASLYHDDVMDEALVRRGVPSANAAYGNATAILVGDLLFGQASSLIADLGAEAVRIQADTFVRLCAGQIRDDRPCPEGVDPVEYYLSVLRDKTGSLIATAARYGAIFAGCDAPTVEVMAEYGERLGITFQLVDDLIDITSDGTVSGKTPGTDLREGVDTLAVLYAKASTDPDQARLRELLATDLRHDDAALGEALALLRGSRSLTRAREHTMAVAEGARELLTRLPASPAVPALDALVTGVLERVA